MALTRTNQPGAAGLFYQGIPDFFLKESNGRLMAGVIVATFMSNYHQVTVYIFFFIVEPEFQKICISITGMPTKWSALFFYWLMALYLLDDKNVSFCNLRVCATLTEPCIVDTKLNIQT